MPAASWRIIPARNISRWDAISASFGFSRRMGRKYRDRRMKSLEDLCLAGLVLRRRSEAATAVELQGPVPPARSTCPVLPVQFHRPAALALEWYLFAPGPVSPVTKQKGSTTDVSAIPGPREQSLEHRRSGP